MKCRSLLLVLILLFAAGDTLARKAKGLPTLGSFAAPADFIVKGPDGTLYRWTGTASFTPSGSETRRSLSGVGSFTPVGIPPIPTPTPPPVPTPTPSPTPQPVPPGAINVRTMGVKGDGVTIDRTALNALVQNAPAHATLYFPSGTYLVDDAIKVYRTDLAFIGDGDASIIKSVQGSYHFQIGHGGDVTGISFKNLQLYGTPGLYMADGTCRGGVLNFGGKGVVFDQMLFRGCAEPILDAGAVGGTYGTVIHSCRFNGYGRMCLFLNGGERVSDCQIVQDDPNLFGERSSHGFYIHGGCKDVEIADTLIQNARKYAGQIYSESEPSSTDNIRLLRLKIVNCANGVICAHGSPLAGRLTNGLIEGCTITGTYAGSSIAVKNGDGVIVRGNTIDGNTGAASGRSGAGAYFGVFAPYEAGYSLSNILVENNIIKGCDRGIWTLPSNGGTFSNIVIRGNQVTGNRKNYDITGPGVIWTPGRAPGSVKVRDSASDIRPSDDSSLKKGLKD